MMRRKFGRYEEFVARMTFQCYTRCRFSFTLHIGRSNIEIIHAMSDGIINKLVDSFLINFVIAFGISNRRPAHATITEKRYFIGCTFGVTISHLIRWNRRFREIVLVCFVIAVPTASGQKAAGGSRSGTYA